MSEMDDLDGLDDFGSDADFSDQLDDFMDSDLGDDTGVDGDSELDSFFEDLSTIDDLEVKDEEPAAEEPAQEVADEPVEDFAEEPEPAAEPEEPKEKKPILIPAIISAVVGLILGGIVNVVFWLMQPSEPMEPVVEVTTIPTTTLAPQIVTVIVTTTLPPAPVAPPPPPAPPKLYFVQVANCIYRECVDDYRFLLKRYGYQAVVKKQSERTPMTEVISQQVLGEEETARWVERINRENALPGQAFRKEAGSRYRVTMGLFPDLDTAIRVKTSLNQLYVRQLVFDAKRAEQVIDYSKIRVGGVDNREEAVQLQRILRQKDDRLKGAFVVTELR